MAGAAGPNQQPPLSATKSATINYELDKTIQHTRKALGQIRRLSVAVALNQKEEKDKNGVAKPVPLTDEERKRVEDLVRDAVGYSKDRGDTISVASSPFVVSDKDQLETPIWKDPDNVALFKELIKYLVIAGVIAFVAFGVIRPLLKQVLPQPETKEEEAAAEAAAAGEEGEEGEEGEDEGAEVALSPEAAARLAYDEKLAKALALAKENPRMVANLIKEWMGSHEQQR